MVFSKCTSELYFETENIVSRHNITVMLNSDAFVLWIGAQIRCVIKNAVRRIKKRFLKCLKIVFHEFWFHLFFLF